jgi:hypothetical protein
MYTSFNYEPHSILDGLLMLIGSAYFVAGENNPRAFSQRCEIY